MADQHHLFPFLPEQCSVAWKVWPGLQRSTVEEGRLQWQLARNPRERYRGSPGLESAAHFLGDRPREIYIGLAPQSPGDKSGPWDRRSELGLQVGNTIQPCKLSARIAPGACHRCCGTLGAVSIDTQQLEDNIQGGAQRRYWDLLTVRLERRIESYHTKKAIKACGACF